MSNLSVNLDAYSHSGGLSDQDVSQASLSGGDLQELNKALEAGHLQGGAIGDAGQTTGGALKVESLESSLKLITFRESDIRFWKRIPKKAAFNTVEEYNVLSSYGADFRGGFNNEGELPEEEDSIYTRKAELVKFMGTTRSVTHPMQLVRTHIGSVVQQEISNGIMWLLRKANRGLFYADSNLIAQEFNGLYAQHLDNPEYATLEDWYNGDNVIDLRGKTLKESDIETATHNLLRKFAQPNVLMAPPVVLSDFAKGFYARQRIMQGGSLQGQHTGGQMTSFVSQTVGTIALEYDIFARKQDGKATTAAANSTKAPSAPTSVSATVVTSDAISKFSDGVGTYFYAVTAVNRYGESSLTQITAGLVTVANVDDAVDLEFTATAGAYTPSSYRIYRSKIDPTTAYADTIMYPIFEIPAAGSDAKRGSLANGVDGAAATKVRDRNRWLPEGQDAFLMDENADQVFCFKQLAPLMKMPLARLSPADRFMILMYGTPILFAPSKVLRFINVGTEV